MQLAIIPPVKALQPLCGDRHFHLILAHLLDVSPRYRQFYEAQRRKDNQFFVLDNGAFELGTSVPVERLLYWARKLGPQEIVLPDTVASGEQTVLQAREAITYLQQALPYKAQYMAVPHGDTWEQYVGCLQQLISIDGVTTIGVVQESVDFFGKRSLVLDRLRTLRQDKTVHVLGNDEYCRELRLFPHAYDWVRSTDSAKPVVWAMAGVLFDPEFGVIDDMTYPGRGGPSYFQRELTGRQLKYAKANIHLATGWAQGLTYRLKVQPSADAAPAQQAKKPTDGVVKVTLTERRAGRKPKQTATAYQRIKNPTLPAAANK
jgi:hypothetical protein